MLWQSAEQDSIGLRQLRGLIWPRAPGRGQLVGVEREVGGSLEPAECSMGWQWVVKVETESKRRLREWQTVHMGGPHSGSF